MKQLNVIIPLVVYPFDIMFSFGQCDDILRQDLKLYDIEDEEIEQAMFKNDTIIGRCVLFSNNATIVRLRHFPETPKDYGCLHHEIFHAITFIMEQIGMILSIGVSDEAYAYLTGYLTERIYDEINKVI